MTRLLLAAVLIFSSGLAFAGDDFKSVFAEYETAYLNNDAKAVKKWLAKDVEISQALHVEGMGSDSVSVSARQLLASMKQMGRPSTIPAVDTDALNIESIGDSAFCGRGEKTMETVVSGESYEEREVKTVCFEQRKGKWLVVSQTIDVYFTTAAESE